VSWKTLVENQTGRRVKRLRTDNGLEFCNTEFDKFCEEHGISRKHTCAYTPQQNGVAERVNRTIMKKVRCMLADSGLSQKFWAEAASTACYLINRSPNSSLEFKVPEQVWSKHKPIYSHLKPFGCIAYVHASQGKLNPRAKKGIFLGYPEGVKGYRIWLIEDKRVVISRDIVFNEHRFYKNDCLNQTSQGLDQTCRNADSQQVEFQNIPSDPDQGGAPDPDQGGASNQNQGEAEERCDSNEQRSHEQDEDFEENAAEDLSDYLLARDRNRRVITQPARYAQADFIAFALNTSELIEDEPGSEK